MITENFFATRTDGKRIAGKLYIPDIQERKYPAVIVSHGFNACYRDLEHHGQGFAEAGICCIFYDFCGGSTRSMSDGAMTEMTLLTEAEDLRTVMEYAVKLPYVDPDRLFLLGESQGGFVSAYAAAELRIRGLILWYPAFVIPDDAKKRMEAGVTDVFGIPISPDYDPIAVGIDIYRVLPGYTGPVKLIHGDADGVVPIEYSRRAEEVYRQAGLMDEAEHMDQRVELTVIPGAGHGFNGEESVFAREESIRFIRGMINADAT